MLTSRAEYERFIYSLKSRFPEIDHSTLHFYNTSANAGLLRGKIVFYNGHELSVVEVIDFGIGEIIDYSYTLFDLNQKKIRWYDPQPHPNNPELETTFPHHYHEEPNIKKNRKPAHGISFEKPNLSILIKNMLENMVTL
jgi:hypothetical protein